MSIIEGTLRILKPKQEQNNQVQQYETLFQDKEGVEQRKGSYTQVANLFYDLVSDFYEYGWGHSFHFAPRRRTESFETAMVRYEHYLALRMEVKRTDHVLDVGCGIGGPARNIAAFTGCRITALNNNQKQLGRLEHFNRAQKLDKQITPLKADFMHIPCDDNTFDKVYEIEATCHAPDHVGVYREIFRVLKPGGYFSGYEWAMKDNYDPSNKKHVELKRGIELGNGIPDLITAKEIVQNLKEAGFEVVEVFDYDELFEISWYDPLSNNFNLRGITRTPIGRYLGNKALGWLEYLKLAPKGSQEISNVLNIAAESLIESGKLDTFTPSLFILARKPLQQE